MVLSRSQNTISVKSLMVDKLIVDFDGIVRKHSEHGFIPYRAASSFAHYMLDLFDGIKAQALFENNEYAKKALVHFTKKFGNLQIDDSNGEMSILMPELKTLWEIFLDTSPASMVTECRKWIEQNVLKESMWIAKDELSILYEEHFNSEKDLKAKLKFYDSNIEREKQDKDGRSYHIDDWAHSRAVTMRKLGITNQEVKKYLADYATLTDCAYLLFDILVEEKNYDEAEKCLRNLAEAHNNWSGITDNVSVKLKEMYLASGQTEKYGNILKKIICNQNSMNHFKEYKGYIPQREWTKARSELLDAIVDSDFKMEVLAFENMTDDLYKVFCDTVSRHAHFTYFKEFGKALCPKYETEFVKMFAEFLDHEMEKACNRREYRNVVREVRELFKYNGGLQEVNRLKTSWQNQFKNRSAMIDELDRI